MVASSGVGLRGMHSPSSLQLQARSGTASPRMLGNETVASGSGSGAQTPASSVTMVSQTKMAALALPSPRPALKRSAEQAEVEARSPSPRSSAGDAAVRREAMVPLLMPRLTLNQINVMGSPEAECQVQEMQGQLVHMAVDMQKLRLQFQTEADAFCEGRAQERHFPRSLRDG